MVRERFSAPAPGALLPRIQPDPAHLIHLRGRFSVQQCAHVMQSHNVRVRLTLDGGKVLRVALPLRRLLLRLAVVLV